ncbi:hypothetical protein ACIREE_06935 [Streptomyces sp. NPDC102467]|uniref:LppU/SCO3897 family protein n=1 Tax=Streptomyces sp. NPDC102467 TaxID=3366179 RepID=UPI0038135E6C
MSEHQIPPAPQPGPGSPNSTRGCLVAVVTVAAVAFVVLLLSQVGSGGDASDDSDATDDAASSSYSSYSPPAVSDTFDPYASSDPYGTPTSEPPPSPYTSGTCLDGTLPDSTTAQAVDDVDEVDCSASDAHYRVIQTIPMTSELSQCDSNSGTQYAFSSRYTMNGAVINEYVYCLVGLGSYAR